MIMTSETFEKVKIDLRSILLSSKHGVAAADIQSDYEQLSCQRLPYKDLGFNDVKSLMRAMPDVAKEVRSQNGEITYHAVCDESTAHIQKLVSSQLTKKKVKRHHGIRGRGRGGFSRGGYVSGRGGHGSGERNNLDRNTRPFYTDPRSPLISKVPLLSRWGQIIRIPPVSPLASSGSYDNERRDSRNRFISGDNLDILETDKYAQPSRISRAVFGRGTTEQTQLNRDSYPSSLSPVSRIMVVDRSNRPFYTDPRSPLISKVPLLSRWGQIIRIPSAGPYSSNGSYDNERRDSRNRFISGDRLDISEADKYAQPSRISRAVFGRGTTEQTQSNRDSYPSEQITSPIYNLKVGVSQTGERFISKSDSYLRPNGDAGDSEARTSKTQFDLRNVLKKWHAQYGNEDYYEVDDTKVEKDFERMNLNSDAMKTRRVMNDNKTAFQKNLPPRLLRKQHEHDSAFQENKVQAPVKQQPHFSEQNTVYTMDSNWVPPENGFLYLQAYHNHFAQRGTTPPEIDTIPGKVKGEKGYYGRLLHQDKHYYPLEIMRTRDEARQNVARAFCLKNGISLIHEEQIRAKPEQDHLLSDDTTPSRVNGTSSRMNDAAPTRVNGTSSRMNGTTPSRVNGTTPPRVNDTTPPRVNDTTPPRVNDTISEVNDTTPSRVNEASSEMNVTTTLKANDTSQKVQQGLNVNEASSKMNVTTALKANDTSQKVQQGLNVIEAGSQQQVKSSQESHQRVSPDSVQLPPLTHHMRVLPEVLEKVYKILKPNGIWVLMLEKLYQESYAEPLGMDFLSEARLWPEYFTLEQSAPNRFIVYPVQDALTKNPVLRNNNISEANIKDVTTTVLVPPALLPTVGSKLQVLFSFAYSPEDMYVQTADMENLVYEIDEVLNKKCPTVSPPEVDTVAVNSMMAAIYEGSWYRTQIMAVEKDTVSVYFIDYGNREKVTLADLRPVPQEQFVLETPSLAIKCALRKSKAGEWCKDVTPVLTELSETHPFLSAMILEHKDDHCVIDLFKPDDSLVSDMLIEPAPTTPVQQMKPVLHRTVSSEQGKGQLSKNSPLPIGMKLFADDPEPLVIPDCDYFAVYVCKVMSENSVLLRIVDDEYSEKLDELEQKIAENFYSWPVPKQIKHSNIYAGMVLAGAEDADYVEHDEDGKEKLSDQNKYYRIRVLKENKDGSCDCYLPDHGHNEVLDRSQLKEIDPDLNLSLSYQAVLAKLHGLDKLPDKLKPMAVRILIKLLSNWTYYAVKKGKSAEKREDDSVNIDVTITNRVRKIISCMRDIQPSNVAKIYQDVYGEPVENVEEVIKNIPGYGYWRESLEVDLFDTSQEDSDVNINETVLAAIDEMEKVQSQGGSVEDVWKDIFSSNTSQADTDSGSVQGGLDGWTGKVILPDAETNGTDDEAKLSRVKSYVQDLTEDDSIKSTPGRPLYTWDTKPKTADGAVISCHSPSETPLSSPPSLFEDTCLPKFWKYPLLTFVSLHIVRVENPSDFVAIPMEQRGALEKLEGAIAQYFSTNTAEPAATFSDNVLYAVKSNSVYRRTLYLNLVGDGLQAKVFFPDHHSYDTVLTSELFLLPKQFYSLPFLAYRMKLGGIVPVGQDWPTHVIQWFKTTFCNKCLYALITSEEGSSSDRRIPGALVVRLIDTSGSEDLVVEEYMEIQGMATSDPGNDN